MTDAELQYTTWCVAHDTHSFYTWRRWKRVRAQVLAMDRHECQRCRSRYHRYTMADTVHHVNHLKARPDLALEVYYRDPATHEQRRNLISLCHDCHEEVHGYRRRGQRPVLTRERWD